MNKKKSKDSSKKSFRHPTKEKGHFPTYSLTNVSIGEVEQDILRYMQNNQDVKFNVRQYALVIAKKKRSSIYDKLNRLLALNLVSKPFNIPGNWKITNQGKEALRLLNIPKTSVETSRRECRKPFNLSTHYIRFKIPIKNKTKFHKNRISKLNPLSYHSIKLVNMTQHFLKFSDATIIIKLRSVDICLHDIIAEDTPEASFKCLNKALDYVKKINSIGLEGDSIILENPHYARVESLLAEFLEQIDKRYFIELGKGRKFYIDRSHKLEDETTNEEDREKLDNVMRSVFNADSDFFDVDKQKEVSALILKSLYELKNITKDSAKIQLGNTLTLKALIPEKDKEKEKVKKFEQPKEKSIYFG